MCGERIDVLGVTNEETFFFFLASGDFRLETLPWQFSLQTTIISCLVKFDFFDPLRGSFSDNFGQLFIIQKAILVNFS